MVWQAARASGAAPSYFRAFGRFLDGGLIANNPTLDAMTEIHEYNMALHSVGRRDEIVPVSVVVSLGTGLIPVTEQKGYDVYKPESIIDAYRLVQGVSAIGKFNAPYELPEVLKSLSRFQVIYWWIKPQLLMDVSLIEPERGAA